MFVINTFLTVLSFILDFISYKRNMYNNNSVFLNIDPTKKCVFIIFQFFVCFSPSTVITNSRRQVKESIHCTIKSRKVTLQVY